VAAAEAAVDPDDGETGPWASCVSVSLEEAGDVSTAVACAQAMFGKNGRVLIQGAGPHIAVGLGVDYARVGSLKGQGLADYNEYCRIEEHLKSNGLLLVEED